MKKSLYILLLLTLTLPFREGMGVGSYAHAASPYEVQVPMSARPNSTYMMHTTSSARVMSVGSGGTSSSTFQMHTTARQANKGIVPTGGRFTTYVPAIDADGHAYTPSQITAGETSPHRPHIRKVGHDDDEDDPFMPSQVDPIGNTPWMLFILLAIGYGYSKLRKRSA